LNIFKSNGINRFLILRTANGKNSSLAVILKDNCKDHLEFNLNFLGMKFANNPFMRELTVLFFSVLSTLSWSQQQTAFSAGGKIALLVSIGTHQTAVGLSLNTYAALTNLQLNGGVTYRFFATNLGVRCHFGEWRFSAGAVIRGGKPTNPINFDFSGVTHQSAAPYSLGYSYLFYRDRVGTAQNSGAWNLGIQRVDLLFENDVFAGQAKDRYRTGFLSISYRDNERKASLGLQLWTGETKHSIWNHEKQYHMPNGYRDISALPYGYLNHGILFGEIKQLMAFNQIAGIRLGWDSEQIRHIFQNRISHDLVWLPAKVQRNTPHYPRLNNQGNSVFTKEEIRKSVPYYQVFLNDGLPY
jgi:hypothetical protein